MRALKTRSWLAAGAFCPMLACAALAETYSPPAPGEPFEPRVRLQESESANDAVPAWQADGVVRVDGRLTREEWNAPYAISAFTQRDPMEGRPGSERTLVAVQYNESSLFIAAWCYDSDPPKIVAAQMRRDFDLEAEDNFIVVLDTYSDRRSGYRFATNPNGARAEALILENGQDVNADWNGVWSVASTRTAAGWFVEIEIPFSTLKFSPNSEQRWAINFERNIARKREQQRWQAWSRDAQLEEVSRAGRLTGLRDLRHATVAEFRPYATGGVTAPRDLSSSATQDFGGDVNVLINPTLKLSFTVNPDFAQAESDRAKVNLTRFSLSLPEKREFFLDGSTLFDTPTGPRIRPFYSRRIGIAEDRSETPILLGARLTGKHRATSVGALLLQTGEDSTSPSTSFSVVRVKRDIWSQSSFGLVNTNKLHSNRYSGVYGVDFLYSTSTLFGDKNLAAGGALLGSYTSDRSARLGSSHHAFVRHEGDLIALDVTWERVGRDFNPEVGFLERESYQLVTFESDLEPRPQFLPGVKKLKLKPIGLEYFFDAETGDLQSLAAELRPLGFKTRSGESFKFNVQRFGERLDKAFDIHDDVVIPTGEYWFTRYELKLETFGGRRLALDTALNWGDFFTGSRTEWEARLTYRLNAYLSASLDTQVNTLHLREGTARVTESGGRLDFALSPRFFGAVQGQWNNEDDEALLDLRLTCNPKPGMDVFLVLNQVVDTAERSWRPTNTTLLSKVVWRFTL